MSEFSPTPISALRGYSFLQGVTFKLPDFAPGQPFYAKLMRPSMLKIASEGRIPNPLLASVSKLFMGNGGKTGEVALNDIANVVSIFVDAAMVEPTYQELREAGYDLTDEQKSFIMAFCQQGVAGLEQFREQPKVHEPVGDEQVLPDASLRLVSDS